MISEQRISPIGYIVYESQGVSQFSHKETWIWFPNYDKAIAHAIDLIKRRTEVYNTCSAHNSVIIYRGTEAEFDGTHDQPYEEVVFQWRNY